MAWPSQKIKRLINNSVSYELGETVRIAPYIRSNYYLPNVKYLIIKKNIMAEFPFAVIDHLGNVFTLKQTEIVKLND